MRIATLQFSPKLGDVQGNIQRANELLRTGTRDAVSASGGDGVEGLKPDILVLSEMALTGYNFPSLSAIKPYLEHVGEGPSGIWAKETARRLGCKVCVGYPEVVAENTEDNEKEAYYNSLLVVNGNGDVLVNYRKSFLYYTDETWALEGDVKRGFARLPFSQASLGGDSHNHSHSHGSSDSDSDDSTLATTFGICMDINPYRFEAPWTAWEFANRILDSKSQLVIISMAWLTHSDREQLQALGTKPELDTFNYWIQRLMPLFRRKMEHDQEKHHGIDEEEKRVVVVFSNRVGEEQGHDDKGQENDSSVRYAGTSAVLAFSQRPSSSSSTSFPQNATEGHDSDSDSRDSSSDLDVKILCWDLMGATEEGICFADTASDPRMVFSLVKT